MEKDKKISELDKLETVTGEEVALVEMGKKNYGLPMSLLAKASDIEDVNRSIEGIRSDISDLQIQDNYGVASWSEDDLAPECTGFFGSWEFLNKWNVYLLDTTDNTGETTTPVGKLMRNNLFRFEDGSFAPTVGITEEMRAECDVELYLDEAHQQKYCDAGAFNAETFYNEHGMAKLYNVEGIEVRVLRPWETTETKYTIGIGRDDTVYLLDSLKGKSGRVWKGLFAKPTVWDGIDVSDYVLPPTAMSPSPVCTIGDKPRSFFFLYEGETNCRSSAGQSNLCTMFQVGRTYPRVSDMSQVTNTVSYTHLRAHET